MKIGRLYLCTALAVSQLMAGGTLTAAQAQSQPINANVVAACGTPNGTAYSAGTNRPATQNTNGVLCDGSSSGVTSTVQGPGTVASPSGGVLSTSDNPGPRTIVPLDISTVTTGNTAVTALNTGHKTAGGFLVNPQGATINLCINEQTTASGTTTAAGLVCISPGQTYILTPSAGSVSVITSDSSHPFGGEGLN